MDKKLIEQALLKFSEIAKDKNTIVDMTVFGGSALAIAFNYRNATKDIDAVFENNKKFVYETAEIVSEELSLPKDWINDAVKGYLSGLNNEETVLFKSYPNEEDAYLRIFIPTPEYLLAMKTIDVRVTGSEDVNDVKKLIKLCDIKSVDDVLLLIEKFYGKLLIQPKTIYVLQEIFEDLDDTPALPIDTKFEEQLKIHKIKKA